jgi:phage shock protein A
MNLLARLRRAWTLHRKARERADLLLERMILAAGLHLADARAEISLCQAQESRLHGLQVDEVRAAAMLLEGARQAVRQGQADEARELAGRHLAADRRAALYAAELQQLREGRYRLETLASSLEMKLMVLEHQRQLLMARQQLTAAQGKLLQGMPGSGKAMVLEAAEEELLGDALALEAYQELTERDTLLALPGSETTADELLQRLHHEARQDEEDIREGD